MRIQSASGRRGEGNQVECVQRLQLVLLVVLGHVGWWIIGHRRDGLHHGLLAEPRHLDELGDGDAGVRVGVKQPGNEPTRVRGEPRRKGGDVGLRWIAVQVRFRKLLDVIGFFLSPCYGLPRSCWSVPPAGFWVNLLCYCCRRHQLLHTSS
jgi:hypothetical protein